MHNSVNGLFFYSALGILHSVVLPQSLCQAKQILRAGAEITGVHLTVKLWELLASTMGQEKQEFLVKPLCCCLFCDAAGMGRAFGGASKLWGDQQVNDLCPSAPKPKSRGSIPHSAHTRMQLGHEKGSLPRGCWQRWGRGSRW